MGGVNVGGGSSTGRAIFAVCGGLSGAYYGFYLQSKYMEERRVRSRSHADLQTYAHLSVLYRVQVQVLVEAEARKRLAAATHTPQQSVIE